ncbi:MAG: hypothetical protein WKG00_29045 [Polyangiaceae bacterium]
MSRIIRSGAALAAVAGALFAVGCADALVGGQCAEGFAEREGACVESILDQSSGSGSASGGAGGGSSSGTGAGPVHPSPTSASSGAGAGNSGSGASGGGPTCAEGETACGQLCTDTQTDSNNCGACGISCPTEVCIDGFCQGATAGHNVVLGMGFESVGKGTPASILLGNAVFLAANEPVRVLEYKPFSSTGSPTKVKTLLQNEAKSRMRTLKFSNETSWGELGQMLHVSTYDVLFVHNQDLAEPGDLAEIGAGLNGPLGDFLAEGGVVVTLATAIGTNEMDEFLTSAGLLDTTAISGVAGQNVFNEGFLDALGQNVLSPFLAKASSARIETTEVPGAQTSFVILTSDDAPLAVHKVVPIQ